MNQFILSSYLIHTYLVLYIQEGSTGPENVRGRVLMFRSFGQLCNNFSYFGRYHSGGMIMMGIGLILILVIAYFIFKKGAFSGSNSTESALELLQKRYVNGEITEDEYLSKKKTLKGSR